MRPRPSKITTVGVWLLLAAGCGPSGPTGPGFTNVSELDAIWHVTGTFSFMCAGSTENLAIDSKVYVFAGAFDEPAITYPTYPSRVCGTNSFALKGSIDASGNITGNVSTNGGNPVLSDTLTGRCTKTACQGQSANTGLIQFKLANTGEDPFDGAGWSVQMSCSDGMQAVAVNGGATVTGGAFTVSPRTGRVCTSTGSIFRSPSGSSLAGKITSTGAFSGTLSQGTDPSVTLSGTATSLTSVTGTGNFGTTITLSRGPP